MLTTVVHPLATVAAIGVELGTLHVPLLKNTVISIFNQQLCYW